MWLLCLVVLEEISNEVVDFLIILWMPRGSTSRIAGKWAIDPRIEDIRYESKEQLENRNLMAVGGNQSIYENMVISTSGRAVEITSRFQGIIFSISRKEVTSGRFLATKHLKEKKKSTFHI